MPNTAVSRLLLALVFALEGCTSAMEQQAPTPTVFIHVYSSFSAYAFLDANDNGQADAADTPVEDATFTVTLPGGTEFGDQTDAMGYAYITIPASVEYPVNLRMEAPKDRPLKAIEPSTLTLSETTGEPIQFLFSSR